MPTYFFHLKTQRGIVRDPDGTDLADEAAAEDHARCVARELMTGREARTRSWRLDVRDHESRRCFELLFAAVDDTIDHLTPEIRGMVESLCARSAALNETFNQIRLSSLQLRATLARFDRTPYLVATNGLSVFDQDDHHGEPTPG